MKGDRKMKRFMKRMNEKKGFTLAELLIVVAIIAVLVAVAIPVFNSQLEKSRDATDQANIRSAYAELAVQLIDGTIDLARETSKAFSISGKGTNETWDNLASGETFKVGSTESPVTVTPKAKFTTVTFTFDNKGVVNNVTLN
jgi:type IV pilus assembly protein PilA